ncbi:hypothetical protein [Dactylosporangium sp. NPDC048998]|uniref:hypothetical protein n=1 Tax=Dactylosporangium sp. NPDC048998 TaxID=3363976 RepID=UPI003722EF17
MDVETLVGTLRARADGDTDAAALLAGVTRTRRRRSRRIAAGAAAAAVLAVGGLAALVVPRSPSGGYAVPEPPSATGPAAVAATVGSDPLVIHFGVGRFPYPVRTTEWSVVDGVERLSLWGNTVTFDDPHEHDDTEFLVDLALAAQASSAPVTGAWEPTPNPHTSSGQGEQVTETYNGQVSVAGQPARVISRRNTDRGMTQNIVSWEPTPGVWAQLSVRGPLSRDETIAFASTLRLDVTHRCAVRVRVTAMPEGARLTGCRTSADSSAGWLQVRGPAGTISVAVAASAVFDPGTTPTADAPASAAGTSGKARLRNGWTYEVLDPAGNTQNYTAGVRITDPYLEIFAQGGYGLADVLLLAGGLSRAG